MSNRISTKYLQNLFRFAAERHGWDIAQPIWTPRENGQGNKSRVGAVFLSNATGGWEVVEMANENGGERAMVRGLSAAEMVAWLQGAAMPVRKKITVWIATTEGNCCPVFTSVHASERDAIKRVLFDLGPLSENYETAPANIVCEVWAKENDGPCLIEADEIEVTL